jgi:hypothetical protein
MRWLRGRLDHRDTVGDPRLVDHGTVDDVRHDTVRPAEGVAIADDGRLCVYRTADGGAHAAGSNERARGLGRGGDIPCAPERDVALPDGDAVMDLVTHLHRLARPIEHKALPQLAARRVAFHPNPRNWRDGVTSR